MRLSLLIPILYLVGCSPSREEKLAAEAAAEQEAEAIKRPKTPKPPTTPTTSSTTTTSSTPPTQPTTPTTPPPASPAAQVRAFTGVRPYGDKAPWNIPVKNLPLHPESKKYADFLWQDFNGRIPEMNFRKYTYPVYDATKATDMYLIKDKNNWDNKATKCSGSRGIGVNYLAMLVRPWEIEKGVIEHALSMPIVGTSGQFFVAPATKLEHPGKVGNIPEGMRFALKATDAEIDAYINSLTGVSTIKKRTIRIIFVALRDYGWFITDTAGGHAFQFEAPESAQTEWERIGVLPGQSVGGVEHPRFSLSKFLTADRIITIVPSDQYPK